MPSKFILETSYDVIFDRNYNIHRTIQTKAEELKKVLGDHYFMIGFYNSEIDVKLSNQFINARNQYWDALLNNFETIFNLDQNSVLFGNWISADMTPVFMLPLKQTSILELAKKQLASILKEDFTDEEIIGAGLSWAFYSYFTAYHCKNAENVIVSYHDWKSGLGQLLYQQKQTIFSHFKHKVDIFDTARVKFMYTIHETCFGRQYIDDPQIDPIALSKSLKLTKMYNSAKMLITTANLFTAITQSLSDECEQIYSKRPEFYLYTGVNSLDQKGELDDTQLNFTHKFTKAQIMKFVQTAFYGQVNLDRTSIIFTAGRDFVNDGFELFLDSVSKLNLLMKDEEFVKQNPQLKGRSIICIVLHESEHKGLNIDMLRKTSLMKEAQDQLLKVKKQVHDSLIRGICKSQKTSFNDIKLKDLCDQKQLLLIKNIQSSLAALKEHAPLVTHEVDPKHALLKKMEQAGITNAIDDYAKVIWIPEKLTSTSVVGLDFKEFVRGSHLGVFAGMYKPFSYKCPECICNGTASIVSSTQGFGSFIQNLDIEKSESQKQIEQLHSISVFSLQQAASLNLTQEQFNKQKSQKWINCHFGVQVLDRRNLTYQQQVDQLTDLIVDYLKLNMYERIQLRNTMTRNSHEIDWKVMVKKYVEAYDFASMK